MKLNKTGRDFSDQHGYNDGVNLIDLSYKVASKTAKCIVDDNNVELTDAELKTCDEISRISKSEKIDTADIEIEDLQREIIARVLDENDSSTDELETHQQLFDDIKYRGGVNDTGMILGERKGRWELRRYRKPCWAKNLTSGDYISECSPHKKNLTVYIPSINFVVRDEILIFVNGKYSKILVTKKVRKTYAFQIIETWMKAVVTRNVPISEAN